MKKNKAIAKRDILEEKPVKKNTILENEVGKKRGRPCTIDEKSVQKICMGLRRGFKLRHACLFAGILPSTFHERYTKNTDFLNKMELKKYEDLKFEIDLAKAYPNMRAREVLFNAVDEKENPLLAINYLKSTDDDFAETVNIGEQKQEDPLREKLLMLKQKKAGNTKNWKKKM